MKDTLTLQTVRAFRRGQAVVANAVAAKRLELPFPYVLDQAVDHAIVLGALAGIRRCGVAAT